MIDFTEIAARDAATNALWFTGPNSFTAFAARDRRLLLAQLAELKALAAKGREVILDFIPPPACSSLPPAYLRLKEFLVESSFLK